MTSIPLGGIRFLVEHRSPGPGGGPTLRVYDAEEGGHERLRFDCFQQQGHWHLDPAGADTVTLFDPGLESIGWTVDLLRHDFAGLAARANLPAPRVAADALAAALDRIETLLRNPPLDLDAVRAADRHPSRGEKWALYPEDVLPLWVADMDFPIADPIRRMLRFAVERSDVGYPIHPAPTDIGEITAARMRERFGWTLDPARVEVLCDVVQGLAVSLLQFAEPGEGAVVQTPIYPPFLGNVRSTGRRLVEAPLAYGARGYEIDLDALAAKIDAGTRLVLICNPHNPTGRVFRRNELDGIAELALRHDLVVVSDEIHADLVYPGAHHVPFGSLSPEVAERTVTLTGASKAFNVAGLRCGLAIFGSEARHRRFNGLPRHARGGISLLGFEAIRMAWLHAQPWLDQVLAYLQQNRDHVARFVAQELPGVRLHAPEGTYLAWLDCNALALEPSPYEFFLQRARVALSDGPNFGTPGRGFVRINFATSRAILGEALERMAKALRAR
ncbi:MAG TPA: MalY/PatB family protein [Myxococcota bacterium]|nr:MalY/PatB family protein [Myxococcota bacterium]